MLLNITSMLQPPVGTRQAIGSCASTRTQGFVFGPHPLPALTRAHALVSLSFAHTPLLLSVACTHHRLSLARSALKSFASTSVLVGSVIFFSFLSTDFAVLAESSYTGGGKKSLAGIGYAVALLATLLYVDSLSHAHCLLSKHSLSLSLISLHALTPSLSCYMQTQARSAQQMEASITILVTGVMRIDV